MVLELILKVLPKFWCSYTTMELLQNLYFSLAVDSVRIQARDVWNMHVDKNSM